jgi:GNAT superfamily N-acetyltransferase
LTGVAIRDARVEDHAAWLPLWKGYNAVYGREGPTAIDPAITAATWARFHDPAEPMFCLVAEEAGALRGLAHGLLRRSTTMLAPSCYLQDLFTDEAARGRGVGRALIEAVAARARALGAGRLYWQTHESNAPARRLYDALAVHAGFIVYRMEV